MQSRGSQKISLHKRSGLIALSMGACLLGMSACLAADSDQRANGGGGPPASEVAAAQPFGQVIRIPLPLDSKAVARVRRAVRQTLDKARTLGSRPVLIFEFDAARGGVEASQGTSFGDAYELANFLSSEELNWATTVAYLPQSIRGHAVLLALACDQIIMADGTTIGAAGADEQVIHETVRSAIGKSPVGGGPCPRHWPSPCFSPRRRPDGPYRGEHGIRHSGGVGGIAEAAHDPVAGSCGPPGRAGSIFRRRLAPLGIREAIGCQPAGGGSRPGIAVPGR